MKSLKPRLLTAVFGISLLLIVLFVGEMWQPVIGVITGVAAAFMVGEYLNAKKLLKIYELSIPCMMFAVALSILISIGYIYMLITAFLIVSFAVLIFCHNKISYMELAYAVFGTLLISFGMSSLAAISYNEISVAFYFCTAFALPWMADAGGFFIGASMGKHKLCPQISPKKTVEGAVGAVVFCVISAVLIGVVFQYLILSDVTINFIALIILGILVAPISILGDLSFSLIKRNLNIKDYGSIFPGHGGVLDRFDSIIFTVPVFYVVNELIPFITLG